MKQLSYMLLLTISCSSFAMQPSKSPNKSPINSPLGGSREDVEGATQAPRGSFDLTLEVDEPSPHSGKRKTRRGSFDLPVRSALTDHARLKAFLDNLTPQYALKPRQERDPAAAPGATLAYYTLQLHHGEK